MIVHNVTYENALAGNPAIENSAIQPSVYESFWRSYEKDGLSAISWTIGTLKPSVLKQTYMKIRQVTKLLMESVLRKG